MNSENQLPALDGVTYNDNFSVAWEKLSELPSEGEWHRLNRSNESLLQTLLTLDDSVHDGEEESDGAGQEQWRRLDAKLNLLLGLVGELLAQSDHLPKARSIQIGEQGLCVQGADTDADSLQINDLLKIRLYLDPDFPRPLQLCGHIQAVTDDGFVLTYCPFDEVFQDLLNKYVFRQHRRAIAMARRGVIS